MAKLFEISVPDGMSAVKLDSQGRGSVQYTVKNVSARPIDGRAVLVPVPADPPDPNHPVQKGWVKIDGKPERHFDVNGEDTFTVNVAVLPKAAQPGTYGYRLDVVSLDKPDVGDRSAVLKFEVKAQEKAKPKWGILIAVIAVVVLMAAGVGIWLAVQKPKMPDFHGVDIATATKQLTDLNVRIDQPITIQVGKPEDADKITNQSIPPGTPIDKKAKDNSIKLTVGAELVQPPSLIGKTIADARKALGDKLSLGKVANVPNPSFGPGIIWAQSVDVHQNVPSNSAIDVSVTPAQCPVPVLTGIPMAEVLNRVQNCVTLAGFSGNQTQLNTLTQSIPANTPVAIGTPVTVTFPATIACQPPARCFYTGPTARLMVERRFARQ